MGRRTKRKDRYPQTSSSLPRSWEDLTELEADGNFLGGKGRIYAADSPLDSVPPLLPDNGAEVVDKVIYVNGILTDVKRQLKDMQVLANTGASVIGIHTSTQGPHIDLVGCLRDKGLWGISAPAITIGRLLLRATKERSPLHLVGHSRGALLISRALQEVRDEKIRSEGMNLEQIAEQTSHIRIETYGSGGTEFIDGPQYVHVDNKLDPVALLFGTGKVAQALSPTGSHGAGAVSISIKEFNFEIDLEQLRADYPGKIGPGLVDMSVHGPSTIYFPKRVPFEQARKNLSQ